MLIHLLRHLLDSFAQRRKNWHLRLYWSIRHPFASLLSRKYLQLLISLFGLLRVNLLLWTIEFFIILFNMNSTFVPLWTLYKLRISLKTGIQTPMNLFDTSALQVVTQKLNYIVELICSLACLPYRSFLLASICRSFDASFWINARVNNDFPEPASPLIANIQMEDSGCAA